MAASSGVSKGDLVHELAQRLADLAADAEGEPRRTVPRLDGDTSLPYQVTVLARDLRTVGADADRKAGADAITATSRALD